MIDLVSEAVGGRVVACSDEFFADASNLLKTDTPVWKEGVYTPHGKWMDGWESRRRRDTGHDWCVIGLGIPGRILKVTVDTAHFTGNYPERFSLEVCDAGADHQAVGAEWTEVIGPTDLAGDSEAEFDLDFAGRVTHVRFNIHPDGGVARLRIEGEAIPEKGDLCPDGELTDLVSLRVGGEVVGSSDSFFSVPSNMLRPTEPAGMWDGWETRRRRGPGNDWAIFRLGVPGEVEEIHVNTSFFKGNAPGWVSAHVSDDGETWTEVISRHRVEADRLNRIVLPSPARASFLKLDTHPDGGVSRFRVMGRADREGAGRLRVLYVNALLPQMARSFFRAACASAAWVDSMASSRPFNDVAEILAEGETRFAALNEIDWLEAFASHPRIGDRTDDSVARQEQSGALGAESALLAELAEVNARYEELFGFTYIVYATGKSASEMLEIARTRLENSREAEIANATAEQRKITRTRLQHMLCQEAGL